MSCNLQAWAQTVTQCRSGRQAELRDLPWSGLNQIQIVFNQNVNVQQASLSLSGLNVANYSFSGFSYNATTFTATWTLSDSIGADRLTLDLHSTGTTGVTNSLATPLAGAWTNGISSYPSGAGGATADFSFALNVLPGDLNQDGLVNAQDISTLASHWSRSDDVFADAVGAGIVNGQDIAVIASNWLAALPAGTGASVQAVVTPTATNVNASAAPVAPAVATATVPPIVATADTTLPYVGPGLASLTGANRLAQVPPAAGHGGMGRSHLSGFVTPFDSHAATSHADILASSLLDETLLSTLAAARSW